LRLNRDSLPARRPVDLWTRLLVASAALEARGYKVRRARGARLQDARKASFRLGAAARQVCGGLICPFAGFAIRFISPSGLSRAAACIAPFPCRVGTVSTAARILGSSGETWMAQA
jgi:hypothetical protein